MPNNNHLEIEIDSLIEMAFKEGFEKALKKVLELDDPYVLDEFHDRLVEKLKARVNGIKK